MKKIELEQAQGSLADYIKNTESEGIIISRQGKPIAILISVENLDEETVRLSLNSDFINILNTSRESLQTEGGISLEQMKQELGIN